MIHESAALTVRIEGFEGPLDLLLHLIKELKVDIFDIPMTEITDQYLHYLNAMQELRLDTASEYLLMAATLLEIKSRMLLPKKEIGSEEDFYEEGEDPREELVHQLLEYQQVQEAAKLLKELEGERAQFFTKSAANLENYQHSIPLAPGEISAEDLLAALQKMQQKLLRKKPLHTQIQQEELSVEKAMDTILERFHSLKEEKNVHSAQIPFHEFFETPERLQIVNTFLAMLELVKEKQISFMQKETFGEIYLRRLEEGSILDDE